MTLWRRIVAGGILVYGVLMLIGGQSAYTSKSYTVLFDLARQVSPSGVAPTTVWGVGFVVAGLLGLILRPSRGHGDYGLIALVILAFAWSLGLWFAVWPRRVAPTWGGPIWPSLVAARLMFDAGRPPPRS